MMPINPAAFCSLSNIAQSFFGSDASRTEVLVADGLLLSSVTWEVRPGTRLDGQSVGSGQPGPVYAQLYAGYQLAKASALAATAGN